VKVVYLIHSALGACIPRDSRYFNTRLRFDIQGKMAGNKGLLQTYTISHEGMQADISDL